MELIFLQIILMLIYICIYIYIYIYVWYMYVCIMIIKSGDFVGECLGPLVKIALI